MQKAAILSTSKKRNSSDKYIKAIKAIASSDLSHANKIKKMAEVPYPHDAEADLCSDHAYFLFYVLMLSNTRRSFGSSSGRDISTASFCKDQLRRIHRSLDDYFKGNIYRHEYRCEAHYFGYDEHGDIAAIFYKHQTPKFQPCDEAWVLDEFVNDATAWGQMQPEYIKLPGVRGDAMRLHAVVTVSRVIGWHNEVIYEEVSRPLPYEPATKNK